MADNFFRKFIIRFVLNRGEEFEHCVLFILHILHPEGQFTGNASSFEIYSDKVPLGPWNDILKLLELQKCRINKAILQETPYSQDLPENRHSFS